MMMYLLGEQWLCGFNSNCGRRRQDPLAALDHVVFFSWSCRPLAVGDVLQLWLGRRRLLAP
jgi:hypothetical protein